MVEGGAAHALPVQGEGAHEVLPKPERAHPSRWTSQGYRQGALPDEASNRGRPTVPFEQPLHPALNLPEEVLEACARQLEAPGLCKLVATVPRAAEV